ncbi:MULTISPECIES: PA domain-containing protein [unclassified Nocardioides]|uniref:PA domain-containing protein n=1 Tax=unclassified Nocardioides TaxID=2615069 RepID=UPI003616C0E9
MPPRPLAALLGTAALTTALLAGAPPSAAGPDDPGNADAMATRVIGFGDHDRARLSTVDATGRQVLEPLPGPNGAEPGLIVTSDGRSTTVQAPDSDAPPVTVAGPAAPLTTQAAADDGLVELRLEALDRYGRAGVAHVNIFDVETGAVSAYRTLPGDPDAECTAKPSSPASCILVPPGTYSVMALVTTMPADQVSTEKELTIQNLSLVGDPELTVTEDRVVTLDARRANQVEVRTPGARATTNGGGAMELGYTRTATNGRSIKVYQRPSISLDQSFYLQPTAELGTGTLQTLTRMRLEAPDIEMSAPRVGALHPEYYDRVWFSDVASQFPVHDGRDRLRVVDVGHATEADLDGLDLTGALAVAERSDDLSVADQSNAAAAAGATLVAIHNDGPGDNGDPNGTGEILEAPTVRLTRAEGLELLRLGRHDRVTVVGEAATPYVYDLVLKEKGAIREHPTYIAARGRNGNLAEQVREFHGQPSVASTFSEAAYPWQPGDTFAVSTLFPVRGGAQERAEYRLADRDTRWSFATLTPESRYNAMFPHDPVLALSLSDPDQRAFAAGERVRKPVGAAPIVAGPNPAVPFERSGDRMRVNISGFVDADGNHGAPYTDDSGMRTHLVIRAGDTVVGETTARPQGTAQLPTGDSRVTIEFTSDNPQRWNQLSTHTETAWTFASRSVPVGEAAVQPAIIADYDVDVDLRNRTRSRTFDLALTHLDGSTAPIEVTVEASYDDGASWLPASVRGHRVTLPRGDGFVSLRLHAADADGSELRQQVVRAWYVR